MTVNAICYSVIVPVLNEEESLMQLCNELVNTMNILSKPYEIIFVDDGSRDGSFNILSKIANENGAVKVISLNRNYGQTAAIMAGIEHSKGKIIITMDADLQNNSIDIPRLIEKMEEGYDVVSGWRKRRKDPILTRRIPSMIANKIVSKVSRVHLHDFGCTLKAYKREFLKDVNLYGEMHRFIPIFVSWQGGRLAEIEVTHRERKYGRSKYGLSRTFKILLDLITIKFFGGYITKPIYFFGGSGFIFLLLGILFGIICLTQKVIWGFWIHKNPLILLAVFLFIVGVQMIFVGVLAELLIRMYHEFQNKSIYKTKEKVNFHQ